MKLVSYTRQGRSAVGLVVEAGIVELPLEELSVSVAATSPMRALLTTWGDQLSVRLAGIQGPAIPFNAVDIQPVVPDPSKIVAAPVNYVDHMIEMNETSQVDSLGVFLKAPSSVLATGDTVRLPYTDRRFDQEGELAVVIGREASKITADLALTYVAGYTTLLDITMRGGEDRSTRKSFDTFTPLGPWLVTPDEIDLPERMNLRCWVNDTLRQDVMLSDLIWDVPHLVAYASSVMTLYPGDIVSTGTPAGVGQIGDGDNIAVEVSTVGRLEVQVSAAGAIVCPTWGAGRGPKPPEVVTPVRPQASSPTE